jgi:methyl-accepting chemotaxis protein
VVQTTERKDQGEVFDDLRQSSSMDRLSETFENSARRWELIVYPSLFAFIILAAYGFYLVYSLAKDVHFLAVSVDTNMTMMANNMDHMATNIQIMSGHFENVNQKMDVLEPMLTNINSMDHTMQSMSRTTYDMRHDISRMNQNISRPMNFMNNFMPW